MILANKTLILTSFSKRFVIDCHNFPFMIYQIAIFTFVTNITFTQDRRRLLRMSNHFYLSLVLIPTIANSFTMVAILIRIRGLRYNIKATFQIPK